MGRVIMVCWTSGRRNWITRIKVDPRKKETEEMIIERLKKGLIKCWKREGCCILKKKHLRTFIENNVTLSRDLEDEESFNENYKDINLKEIWKL